MNYKELLDELTRRLVAIRPNAEVDPNFINQNGNLVIHVVLPGEQELECTNVRMFRTFVENLEAKERSKSRP